MNRLLIVLAMLLVAADKPKLHKPMTHQEADVWARKFLDYPTYCFSRGIGAAFKNDKGECCIGTAACKVAESHPGGKLVTPGQGGFFVDELKAVYKTWDGKYYQDATYFGRGLTWEAAFRDCFVRGWSTFRCETVEGAKEESKWLIEHGQPPIDRTRNIEWENEMRARQKRIYGE